MKGKASKILSLLLVCCMVFGITACNDKATVSLENAGDGVFVEESLNNAPVKTQKDGAAVLLNNKTDSKDGKQNAVNLNNSFADKNEQVSAGNMLDMTPKGEYNKGVVLVKFKDEFYPSAFGTLEYTSAKELYEGSKWYSVKLADVNKTEQAVEYLCELGNFEKVDYDYVMGVTADMSSVDVSSNPNSSKQPNLNLHGVKNGWYHNGKMPGGSPDVVVAVIDTGVDYNHLDLRNNIWVNTAEIADNGKDDDGNGYIDDIYGWDCVGDDKDPIDDNGHGTHVAGIIAAENNKIGGVGVAFDCKVMVLKAGNSSGYFNNSDIAEAIQYAYMNGASVINMSFGGSNISVAVEEALENAYNSCVLVAAAGNDGACNNLGCKAFEKTGVSYPAALPFVIGVMSTNADGSAVSSFSNYDHCPYNAVEYEVYAVGEGVPSCWPNNKYASLNGTSMAAPTVSGIAALLRSSYTDREVYSTKYIQSQIVNTGTINPYNYILEEIDDAHTVANVYEAMTNIPKPEVNLYDYSVDDSAAINAANNGNGVIDAGETVRLYLSLHNRGGVATDVKVSVDTNRSEGLVDPYFTFVNDTISLSDIGTYSVRESGDKYFEIIVSPDCPNDYLIDFNIRYTYKNGLDENDNIVYEDDGKQKAQFNVSRGYLLPSTITEDTTFTADKLYIVGEDVVIPEGVTVTFEAGCEIQFYDDREYYNSPRIIVYGTLNINGNKDNMVKIAPNERHINFAYGIYSYGNVTIDYANAINLLVFTRSVNLTKKITVSNSILHTNGDSGNGYQRYVYDSGKRSGMIESALFGDSYSSVNVTSTQYYYYDNYIELLANYSNFQAKEMIGNTIVVMSAGDNVYVSDAYNNIIYSLFKEKRLSNYRSKIRFSKYAHNNAIVSVNNSLEDIVDVNCYMCNTSGNFFSPVYHQYASQVIDGYYDSTGNPTVDVYGSLADPSLLWPYVVSVEMFDKDGNAVTTVGREEIKVRVTFNRPMDTTKDTFLTFGTIEPYADYRINGEYISDTVWEGTYTLKAQIENGQNFIKVNNACAAEDHTKTVFGEYQLHEFTVDTTAAMAMNLQAVAKQNGIELTFAQDDYDTLLGYNVYRSTEKDGNYVKLNPAILLPDENVFLDENAEPGKTYWYTYTVVLSDFTESNPAGKVQATALDTMSPSLYHTPVNQGYENNNLVISAAASDNVAVQNVTLYYRAVGAAEWKTLGMSKQNDKYSATIFGSEVTLAGIEYYITATDGINTVLKGSEQTPYTVVIKSADALLGMGDVDGNGSVTTKDALMLMQCLNGDLLLSDDAFKRADLNGDGILSSVEALRILQYVNGKVTTLEM